MSIESDRAALAVLEKLPESLVKVLDHAFSRIYDLGPDSGTIHHLFNPYEKRREWTAYRNGLLDAAFHFTGISQNQLREQFQDRLLRRKNQGEV